MLAWCLACLADALPAFYYRKVTYAVSPVQTTYTGGFNHFLSHPTLNGAQGDDVRASTSIRRSGPCPVFNVQTVRGAPFGLLLVRNGIH